MTTLLRQTTHRLPVVAATVFSIICTAAEAQTPPVRYGAIFKVHRFGNEEGGRITSLDGSGIGIVMFNDFKVKLDTRTKAPVVLHLDPLPSYESRSKVVLREITIQNAHFELPSFRLLSSSLVGPQGVKSSVTTKGGVAAGHLLEAVPGRTASVVLYDSKAKSCPSAAVLGFPDLGADYRMDVCFDTLPTGGYGSGLLGMFAIGAEIEVHGSIKFGALTLHGLINEPLTFKLVKGQGYVHVRGRGTITDGDGKTWRLEWCAAACELNNGVQPSPADGRG